VTVSRFLARFLEYRWSYLEETVMVFSSKYLFLEFRSQHISDAVSLICRVAVWL
jgi:hypothetical protein